MTGKEKTANAVSTEKREFKRVSKKERFENPNAIQNKIPTHVRDLVLLVKNNAEIRRFTALGVINALKASGDIQGEKCYVEFKWTHFCVSCDKLRRDFRYSEAAFINALVESFSKFAASAEVIINTYATEEKILKED